MELDASSDQDDKIDFLIYCYEHSVREGLPFAGKTLKTLFALACESAPEDLDDDRAYDFVSPWEIAELVEKARENLLRPKTPELRLVKNG